MIILKAKFEAVKTLKTKKNIVFSTTDKINDLQTEQLMKISGYLAFSPDVFREKVLQAMKDKKIGLMEDGFTWSQTIRGTLKQIWLKHFQEVKDFDSFYAEKMEMMNEHFKQFL